MINFDNMKTFETTAAVAEGHTILVSFTSNRGGYTSRTYRDVEHAIEGVAAMEASPMCGSMWTATKASIIKYRCPTWEEVTSNGRWSCE
jgi:hypothetical protein